MNQLFKYGENEVRTVMIEDEPWFVAKDICDILDVRNNRDALSRIDSEDKGVVLTDTLGGKQEVTAVNESGLYSLILGSRKPEARAFKRWVTSEVLPAIRKHGGYLTPDKVEEALLNPDTIIRLATQLKTERAEKERLASVITEQAPKVAAYDTLMWAEGINEGERTIPALHRRRVLCRSGNDTRRQGSVGYARYSEGTRLYVPGAGG
jgi:anti-repressor protein